jgi:Ran GTPase-activating protein (RanGAP) involved in mRNA processing and transport
VCLDVQGNRIGSEGLHAIASSLLGNTSLRELVLCDNHIGSVRDCCL